MSIDVKNEDQLRVFLVDIMPLKTDEKEAEARMNELENLVQTFGWVVIVKAIQKKQIPDYKTYIWSGKLEEIVFDMQRYHADVLVIGNILKPRQVFTISEKLREDKLDVRDRVDLILKIFDKHASSAEAKLQIELASIKHMWPRIFGMWMELSRQWWWIGTKWIGETNTERMKRHLKEKVLVIKKKLQEYEKMRSLHRTRRKRVSLPMIWIVGYTNAGKSSLLNLLTGKWVLVEDKLFATLWTHVGKLFLFTDYEKWQGKEVLLNDTIGFIRDLPPQLIEAFSSTLEDSIESDFLLHVVDMSDPQRQRKVSIVHEILDSIGANQTRIAVCNKIDRLSVDEYSLLQHNEFLQEQFGEKIVFISVYEEQWIDVLKEQLVDQIQKLS